MHTLETLLKNILSQMSVVEWAAAIATLVNVYLTIKNNIWCWPWGILSVVLYGYVFWTGGLYSSMGLQFVYYLPMCIVGWYVWLRWGPTRNNDLPISVLRPVPRVLWFGVNIPLAFLLGWIMSPRGAHMPYVDAFVTATSVSAQVLLTKKFLENWWMWIVVNVVYAFYLLPAQKLYVSAGLYAILLVMAIQGALEWTRIRTKEQTPQPETLVFSDEVVA